MWQCPCMQRKCDFSYIFKTIALHLNVCQFSQVMHLQYVNYTTSKNYMQIGFFVILYRFLNQCFGNLAPGIVTFVSAYMQNFMPISATIYCRNHYPDLYAT